jgi:ribosomal protein S18 acetylase RimI-like enzyme
MIDESELDDLMGRGWPALRSVDVDGWIARFSGGVTQRANSVLPIGSPRDPAAAVEEVERLYDGERLPTIFQVSPAALPSGLDRLLDARGYRMRSSTSVEVAGTGTVLGRLPQDGHAVAMADSPDEEWMDLWWSVDGRGGSEERKIAHEILIRAPALYASCRDMIGTAAVGRLALAGDWGGLYCLAVRPDVRRRGLAAAVLRALLSHASERGIRHVWLQVVADNSAARALYSRAGFVPVSSYHYRVRPGTFRRDEE